MLAQGLAALVLDAIKQIGVVADLPELHHQVQIIVLAIAIQGVLLQQHVLIDLLLHLREAHVNIYLLLGRDRGLHLLLSPPQHKGSQDLVQFLNNFQILVLSLSIQEELVEYLAIVEDIRHQKVKQRPQLV